MRKRPRQALLPIMLVISMLAAFAGCFGKAVPASADVDQKAEEMLALIAEGEEDGAYSMMFPDSVSKESFHENFETVRAAFSVPSEHSLSRNSYTSSTNIGMGITKTVTAEYAIKAGDQRFRLTLQWLVEDSKEGFKSFCIIKEMDLAFSQEDD